MIPISVIILTKNEEELIERCIKSILWADEILVLDSGSTDKTKEIATSLGANVYEHEWLGYIAQLDKAISLAKNNWIFVLDCDEIVTPELASSIKKVMNNSPNECDGYSVNRRGDFYGILLPNHSRRKNKIEYVRLFNRQYSGYQPTVNLHEMAKIPGKAIPLQGVLIHWRALMMDEYIASANRAATLEAKALNERGCRVNGLIVFLRPILRFIWCYIAKRDFLLGTRGLVHSMLKATSEYVRYAKLWEMQNAMRVIHPPGHIYSDPVTKNEPNDVVDAIKSEELS